MNHCRTIIPLITVANPLFGLWQPLSMRILQYFVFLFFILVPHDDLSCLLRKDHIAIVKRSTTQPHCGSVSTSRIYESVQPTQYPYFCRHLGGRSSNHLTFGTKVGREDKKSATNAIRRPFLNGSDCPAQFVQ